MKEPSEKPVQEVVAILAHRGIEATPAEVLQWAGDMAARRKRGYSEPNQWAGVKHEMQIPTMLLQLRFGDAE